MNNNITYTPVEYNQTDGTYFADNFAAVAEFIGGIPACPTCNDVGEYEGEWGPIGCQACNSRLIPFHITGGGIDYLDDEETLLLMPDNTFINLGVLS